MTEPNLLDMVDDPSTDVDTAMRTASGRAIAPLRNVGMPEASDIDDWGGADLAPSTSDDPLGEEGAGDRARRRYSEMIRAREEERAQLEATVKISQGYLLLERLCETRRRKGLYEDLSDLAYSLLSDGEYVNPNDSRTWNAGEAGANKWLTRRYRIAADQAQRIRSEALSRARETQHARDAVAGLDWSQPTLPTIGDEQIAASTSEPLLDLDDPGIYRTVADQREAIARRNGIDVSLAPELSRHALEVIDDLDADDPLTWRIASQPWNDVVVARLGPVGTVTRPVAVFLSYQQDAWRLTPSLSLEMIRLVHQHGGYVSDALRRFAMPDAAAMQALLQDLDAPCVWSGPLRKDKGTMPTGEAAEKVSKIAGRFMEVAAIGPTTDGWGRLALTTTGGYVLTAGSRRFGPGLFGASRLATGDGATLDSLQAPVYSAPATIGEAVGRAIDRGLPVLLSSEAAGQMGSGIRVERMRGRPGFLVFSETDGLQIRSTREDGQASIGRLRALRDSNADVTLDAGARELVGMTLAPQLTANTYLKPPQRTLAAQAVRGSMVNASEVGTGKTVLTLASIAELAATRDGFRAAITGQGSLLPQWYEAAKVGRPGMLPPLLPHCRVEMLDGSKSLGQQIRDLDAEAGADPLVCLIPETAMDAHPIDMCAINWHVLAADEAERYNNPLTTAHQSLKYVRMKSVVLCWLLSATPHGKSMRNLDVLVGLALGDTALIDEKIATLEAGDLTKIEDAHRLRYYYGPYFQRVTGEQMDAYLPKLRKAIAMPIDCTPQEMAIIETIREGGRDAYRNLLHKIDVWQAMDVIDDEQREAARREVMAARGMVLSMVDVLVAASVDYEELYTSQAAMAQAIVHSGLIEKALDSTRLGIPTVRATVCAALARSVGDVQALVFGERLGRLRLFSKTMREQHGIDVGQIMGQQTEEEVQDLKDRFWAGDFPIMAISPKGNQGHNLQCASDVMHLDLPYKIGRLEQRIGRSRRIGAKRNYVQPFIPYMRGGAHEHLAGILATRGMEQYGVLDSFEGLDPEQSTAATQLVELTRQVADEHEKNDLGGDSARLLAAVAMFGG